MRRRAVVDRPRGASLQRPRNNIYPESVPFWVGGWLVNNSIEGTVRTWATIIAGQIAVFCDGQILPLNINARRKEAAAIIQGDGGIIDINKRVPVSLTGGLSDSSNADAPHAGGYSGVNRKFHSLTIHVPIDEVITASSRVD
jgi:hypothetical protein